MNSIYLSDNLPVLQALTSESIDLIYIDPPFNTGKTQKRKNIKTEASSTGDRIGFGGKTYRTISTEDNELKYSDYFDDYINGFLKPRLLEAHRLLKQSGTLYLHLDYREVHYAKVLCDEIFGRHNFLNEVIWAYDYGARQKNKWPTKHDNILVYVKDSEHYFFDNTRIDRIPYMAPGLVGPDKAEIGKLPTDCWWMTIVPTNGKEKTGYPTQKPIKLLERIINASCPEKGLILDFFAGSGTTGDAAAKLDRSFILVDNNPEAIEVIKKRMISNYPNIGINYFYNTENNVDIITEEKDNE